MPSYCEMGMHHRVYDHSRILCSNPPKKAWICKACGAGGTEVTGMDWDKESEYDRVRRGFIERKLKELTG